MQDVALGKKLTFWLYFFLKIIQVAAAEIIFWVIIKFDILNIFKLIPPTDYFLVFSLDSDNSKIQLKNMYFLFIFFSAKNKLK